MKQPTFALAVSIVGGAEPSPEQWKALQSRFALSVANRGGVLINDLARADYIIRVDFLPDPLDPNGGTALIDGIRRNVKEVAVSPYPTSPASFASANPYSWGMGNGFGGDYYGYGSYYGYGYPYGYGYNYGYPYDYPGYSSGGGYVVTPPVTKPGTGTPGTPHHPGTPHPPGTHPTNPGDCPPGRVYLPPPPGFVWTPPPGFHPRHPRDDGSSTSGSSNYASSRRSESSYSSNYREPSSSSNYNDSSSSYSSSSSSRSYDPVGPSSYTPSSNTSMSFASSSSSSSSYSAPAPVSSPPSDSGSSRGTENARQN